MLIANILQGLVLCNKAVRCMSQARKFCLIALLCWLQSLGAEVIVTFEGTSESGAQFQTRQSYLPSEIHWGYVFVEIIHHAKQGETQHTVDISRLRSAFGIVGLCCDGVNMWCPLLVRFVFFRRVMCR